MTSSFLQFAAFLKCSSTIFLWYSGFVLLFYLMYGLHLHELSHLTVSACSLLLSVLVLPCWTDWYLLSGYWYNIGIPSLRSHPLQWFFPPFLCFLILSTLFSGSATLFLLSGNTLSSLSAHVPFWHFYSSFLSFAFSPFLPHLSGIILHLHTNSSDSLSTSVHNLPRIIK